jgi:2-polyprenyl-3-methyl-5-hydroxy-6-metoxy-1,4-benzoquinol methylase
VFELAEQVAETLDIGPGTRVFEVDCGSGEFLEPFHLNGFIVGGSDADPAKIELARAVMPDGQFTVGSASQLDPAVAWGVVVCRSLGRVSDPDQLRGLVARMFAKATHAIALLDVPEASHQALLRALMEVGANAVQVNGRAVFARV